MPNINIYPNLKKTILLVKANYKIFDYEPFTSAKIAVQYLDNNDIPIDTKIFIIDTTNGFNEWGSDDKYIENWIKNKIQENSD